MDNVTKKILENIQNDSDHGKESVSEVLGSNRHFYAPTQNIVMSHGRGVYLYDSDGKGYIDAASATFNLSLGYSHPEVLEEVITQASQLVHLTSSYMSSAISRLTEELIKITPSNLDKIHLKISSGSVANEGAIKMAQHFHKGKREIISFFYSHLGQTVYTMNASGNAFRSEPFGFSPQGVLKVPAPHCYRCFYGKNPSTCKVECATKIAEFIKHASSGQVCAAIIEPIFGNGGNITPPREFFVELKKVCDENDICLIFDEIQTGIGRTGEYFAAQHYGVSPNIMSIAKGLGGTGFQVAAIACESKYTSMDPMHHSFTYGSNVMSAAAAYKTLEIIQRDGFLDNVKATGNYILSYLRAAQKKYWQIGDVRGVGLMIGFEIIDENGNEDVDLGKKIIKVAFENGLIMRNSLYGRGSTLKIRPPLILTMQEAKELCERLDRAFSETMGSEHVGFVDTLELV